MRYNTLMPALEPTKDQHTTWHIHTKSEEALEAMLTACKNAQKSIDLEQFIFVDDSIGRQFIDVCAERAAAGVQVRFLWDAAGSFSFYGSNLVNELQSKGISLLFFKTLIPSFFSTTNYRSWYFRNHRRTLVIDDTIGFTGGIGIWEKMAGWRDTQVCIEGPVVKEMKEEFADMWRRAQGKKLSPEERKVHRQQEKRVRKRMYAIEHEPEFIYEANSPVPRRRLLYYRLIDAIRVAEKSIYITTPYFVPTQGLSRVLRLAAHRGVDVRIILPEASDHPIIDLAARSFFQSMFDAGVKIYQYKDNIIHAKTAIIDDMWSTVGTLNMDTISLLHNFEANLISTNVDFIAELKTYFLDDLSKSELVDATAWKKRLFLLKVPEFLVMGIRKFL